ncbi:MAG: hypothetical protein DRI84_02255 [Bacteroidetes bacterium]|nr:MAG: hypothetical protein DRI84_02255 [Bacteroidota bacterium]
MKILKILLLILILSPLGLSAQQQDSIKEYGIIDAQIFPQKTFRAVYKTKIQLKENSYSGLLLVRRNADSSFRIAFVTEVGMKIFEFEFFPRKKNSFHVVSILSYLDKKIIISTLGRDFESLFMTFTAFKQPKIKNLGRGLSTQKYCYKGKRIYTVQSNRVIGMLRKKGFFKKEEIELKSGGGNNPQYISIHHFGIELNIEMTLLNER